MKNNFKITSAILSSLLLFSGCGSNGSNSSSGVFIDDVVSGIKYKNGVIEGYTNEKGEFPYVGGSVEFYLGSIKIGQVSELTIDNKVFIQDIVGVPRTDTGNDKVIKIATLLQSLDSDDTTDTIEITKNDFLKFEDNNSVIKDIDNIDLDNLLSSKNIEKIPQKDVKRHLNNVIKSHGIDKSLVENKQAISLTTIEKDLGDTNSSITLTFSEDIKKDNLTDIIKLIDSAKNELAFDLKYKFNKVTLELKENISSFEGIIIDVDVTELLGYGNKGDKEDLEIDLSSNTQSDSLIDLIPPTVELNNFYKEGLNSKLSTWTISGTAIDNENISNIVLDLNGNESNISYSSGEFSVDLSLKSGLNTYKIIAFDNNGNKAIVSSNNGIYLGNTVAAGGSHSGAIKNGKLYTWGRNNYGQTGTGYTSNLDDETNGTHPRSPVEIQTPTEFTALSFMQNFSLAIDINGDVYSWGHNRYGESGRGIEGSDTCGNYNCRLDIGKIENLTDIIAIDAGLSHALALKSDGTVWAWGSNKDGELGAGLEDDFSAIPVQVNFGSETPNIIQITAGSDFSVALDSDGQVWVWGKNNYGQAGQGEEYGKADQLTPIKAIMPTDIKINSVEAGTGHILALAKNGEVYGWGNNASSQIGYYGYQYKQSSEAWDRTIYAPIKILNNDESNPVIQIYAGGNSSYILRSDKKVYPWGQYGETKEDGSQEYNNLDFPEDKLTAITSVKYVAAGALHMVAKKENDTVFTWKWNMESSLGGGDTTVDRWFYNYPIIPEFPDEIINDENNTTTEDQTNLGKPGGNATVAYDLNAPFLKILDSIPEHEIAGVSQGRELFIAQWKKAPDSRPTLDGLGPLFNANACTTCHISTGRVNPYHSDGNTDQSFLFRVGNENGDTHPIFGGQLQTQATTGNAESNITWSQDSLTNKIVFTTSADVKSGGFNIGGRISPHLIGMGLLDLVSENTILEYEDIDDSNNDGISGRAHWVVEEGETRIGKFGWKAINSTLRTQNAGAMHQDMGLTTPVNMFENCTENQSICEDEPNGGEPEVSETALQQVVDFMTALGVPNRRVNNQQNFEIGSQTFENIGCASCHRPTMTTGVSNKFANLSNQTIYPYTDLLLHDMGESLADGVKEKDASGSEFRTPPLWGIGIVESNTGARFLHDGRAKNIKDAIELHDGEAKKARDNFLNLSDSERENLLEFLRSI